MFCVSTAQAASADGAAFAAASEDGSIAVHSLHFAPIQCTYGNRSVHRQAGNTLEILNTAFWNI